MTLQELYEYLSKYIGGGRGKTPVVICKFGDNPLSDGKNLNDAAFIEWKGGDCILALETIEKGSANNGNL